MQKKVGRSRSETLSLRLTAEEKKLLKTLAEKNGQSMTDYILLSALQYSPASPFQTVLKNLDRLRMLLLDLRKEQNSDAVLDAQEMQSELYHELLAAIRCARMHGTT
jgi:uncharacterized protein (DUF1778 family)